MEPKQISAESESDRWIRTVFEHRTEISKSINRTRPEKREPTPTRPQLAALSDLIDMGGQVITSQWTTGVGRYIKRRTLPIGCRRIERAEFRRAELGFIGMPHRLRNLFVAHPRAQAIIAVEDLKASKRLVKKTGGMK